MNLRNVLAIGIGFLLFGCSGGKVLVSRDAAVNLSKVAIVLDASPVGSRPERVAAVVEAVEQALQTKGFEVLSPKKVDASCAGVAPCGAAGLIAKYQLDAVGRLSITSLSSNNFVVGYVAAIEGGLEFEDSSGRKVESISHREAEKSGILANTGQVLGALSSQADAYSGDSFSALSVAFGRKLVAQLAKPRAESAPSRPAITDIRVTEVDGLVSICVLSSKGGSVVIEGSRNAAFSLREGDPGAYCGAFRFFPAGIVTARLSDPFGNGEQRMLTVAPDCSHGCADKQSAVFVASNLAGPFRRVGTVSGGNWRADSALSRKIGAIGSAPVVALIPRPLHAPLTTVIAKD